MNSYVIIVTECCVKHPLFKNSPNSLQIIVYFDEVEACNPLGGHAGIHKLGNLLIKNFFN